VGSIKVPLIATAPTLILSKGRECLINTVMYVLCATSLGTVILSGTKGVDSRHPVVGEESVDHC